LNKGIQNSLPGEIELRQNYPHLSTGSTKLSNHCSEDECSLRVYDSAGPSENVVHETKEPGSIQQRSMPLAMQVVSMSHDLDCASRAEVFHHLKNKEMILIR